MVHSVDQINITNWQQTGPTPPVPQYSVDIKVIHTNDNGDRQVWEGTELFPNILADFPLKVLRAFMERLILAAVRVRLGIDQWSDYE